MQQPKGIAVVLGVVFSLLIVGAVVGGVLLFKYESKTPLEPVNANAALQLGCTVDADCVSYCGTDPCYQPICGVTKIGAAGSCTCRSICGPIVTGGNTNATTNVNVNSATNTNSNVNSSTNANTNSTVSTTSWKLYTNAVLGFSFQYPANYRLHERVTGESEKLVVGVAPETLQEDLTFLVYNTPTVSDVPGGVLKQSGSKKMVLSATSGSVEQAILATFTFTE
jgi:hypothetical protein